MSNQNDKSPKKELEESQSNLEARKGSLTMLISKNISEEDRARYNAELAEINTELKRVNSLLNDK